ncbi:AfsR/SARP family transcriptional regulator [Tenggerimyces flavus]|uniref:BTAD domain-containing putative transcriptional regulator n=1 Tax=Tenggerimyces flavus TaxID=1708749 RepID=A0ABV7YDG7_9ACTN|nr:AfsR/SARP family transcriptional regulator [Tenggerimyces flavus]MBM7787955.1 DNA-binding SARP family transcriptional activator [Tenggerimyces flavus]
MGAAEVRVLGPVEVLVDGEPVELPGRRSRQVLAALAVDVGRSVSVERLVDLVWSHDPPKSVRTQVAIQISALRRALGEAVETTAEGYRLRDDAVRVDADRAERALREAREQDCADDAVGLLRAALKLWRAEPLVGLRTPGLEIVVRGLGELRTTLADELYDAELRLGRHREVINELRALVEEDPLRERFRAKLMTALWRSGRKVEALEAYQAGRNLLVEQLGIEPDPKLRDLHQAILADDHAADEADAEPAPPAAVAPAEVPSTSPTFTGREAELAKLLGSTARRLALNGPGGVGKSCLAWQVAAALAPEHPDGQLYVNLHGATPGTEPLAPLDVLRRFLRSLGLPDRDIPSTEDEAAARFRTLTAGRRLLVVLDDALNGSQVRPLLPAGPDATTIVTSRSVLADLEDADHLAVGGMDDVRSVELLARLVGTARVAAEPHAATEVVQQCGRLPLAVKIAGARLVGRPDWALATFAARLRDERNRLDELQYGDLAVRASLAVGWQGLNDTATRLLGLIGTLELDELGLEAAAALDGRAPRAVRRDLDQLVEARLLEPGAGPDRFTVHDLVRLDARERSAQLSATERDEAARRLVHFFLESLRTASRLYAPHSAWRVTTGVADHELRASGMAFADRQAIIDWIRAESGNLVRLAHLAASLGGGELVAYAVALHVPVGSQGYWQERREIYELVLAESTADVAYVQRDLGLVCCHLGLFDRARVVLEQAVRTFRDRGDAYLEADTLVLLAEADGEVDHLRRARALSQRFDDYRLEANALVAMSELLAKGGEYADARGCLEKALDLYRTQGSTTGIGRALGKLGELCQRSGDLEDAASYLSQAVEACRKVGMSLREAARTWDLADVLHDLGHVDEARRHRDAAIELGVRLGAIAPDQVEALKAEPRPPRPGSLRSDP